MVRNESLLFNLTEKIIQSFKLQTSVLSFIVFKPLLRVDSKKVSYSYISSSTDKLKTAHNTLMVIFQQNPLSNYDILCSVLVCHELRMAEDNSKLMKKHKTKP